MLNRHAESHRIERIGWLRAAVLGANDGIVSTASLVIGVAASQATHNNILIAGIAGLAAGAMAMATGEYVSVSSQADTENAALAQEAAEIESDYESEHRELTSIYIKRGLDSVLATQVAEKLMAHDALATHARDELGMSAHATARPLQAAIFSAMSFTLGAAIPLAVLFYTPEKNVIVMVGAAALMSLVGLSALAAKVGGAPMFPSVIRVTFWSASAMMVTASVGKFFGVTA